MSVTKEIGSDIEVAILAIGTAAPPPTPQTQAARVGLPLCCDDVEQQKWFDRIYQRSGVETRGSVLIANSGDEKSTDLRDAVGALREFYPPRNSIEDHGPGTATRLQRYAIEAPPLAARAAKRALTNAGIAAGGITHLITVSCTGFVAPGIDVELIERLGLSPAVRRLHVGFMGCHAALNALGAAQSIVRGEGGARVLVCCVELCSLHFAYGFSPDKIVANSLFADGAAAAIVGAAERFSSEPLWRLHHTASLLLPGSRDAMTWKIGDHGFEMTLSPEVPALVRKHLRAWCAEWLGAKEISLKQVQHWAIHPGGPKVVSAAGSALELSEDDLRWSRQILAMRGNMSSTTVLFILEQMATERIRGNCVALGFGPGLMFEGLLASR